MSVRPSVFFIVRLPVCLSLSLSLYRAWIHEGEAERGIGGLGGVFGLTLRSLLFPISMIVMLGLACCRASSSQLARWLKVSRLRGEGGIISSSSSSFSTCCTLQRQWNPWDCPCRRDDLAALPPPRSCIGPRA